MDQLFWAKSYSIKPRRNAYNTLPFSRHKNPGKANDTLQKDSYSDVNGHWQRTFVKQKPKTLFNENHKIHGPECLGRLFKSLEGNQSHRIRRSHWSLSYLCVFNSCFLSIVYHLTQISFCFFQAILLTYLGLFLTSRMSAIQHYLVSSTNLIIISCTSFIQVINRIV